MVVFFFRHDPQPIDSLALRGKASGEEAFGVATRDSERARGLIMAGCEDPEYGRLLRSDLSSSGASSCCRARRLSRGCSAGTSIDVFSVAKMGAAP